MGIIVSSNRDHNAVALVSKHVLGNGELITVAPLMGPAIRPNNIEILQSGLWYLTTGLYSCSVHYFFDPVTGKVRVQTEMEHRRAVALQNNMHLLQSCTQVKLVNLNSATIQEEKVSLPFWSQVLNKTEVVESICEDSTTGKIDVSTNKIVNMLTEAKSNQPSPQDGVYGVSKIQPCSFEVMSEDRIAILGNSYKSIRILEKKKGEFELSNTFEVPVFRTAQVISDSELMFSHYGKNSVNLTIWDVVTGKQNSRVSFTYEREFSTDKVRVAGVLAQSIAVSVRVHATSDSINGMYIYNRLTNKQVFFSFCDPAWKEFCKTSELKSQGSPADVVNALDFDSDGRVALVQGNSVAVVSIDALLRADYDAMEKILELLNDATSHPRRVSSIVGEYIVGDHSMRLFKSFKSGLASAGAAVCPSDEKRLTV